MSGKDLTLLIRTIAIALSEGGDAYDYYDIGEDLKELEEAVSEVQTENAKLRELCAGLLTGYECGHGELCKGCTWDGLGDPKTFPCLPRVKARELGIEVPE